MFIPVTKKVLLRLLIAITIATFGYACSEKKEQPFYKEIQKFKAADKDSFPPKNAILFIGSSSFTRWNKVNQAFPDHVIVNRGFGGSGLNDIINYADDVILPYAPKQVVIYCGENDIATGKVTATDVLQRFMQVFHYIRNNFPKAKIVFVSIKPSPSRIMYRKLMEDSNIMIKQFLSSYPGTAYVDVYHQMLDQQGQPRGELFTSDSLHMNSKGYAIWADAIEPHLVK